MSQQTFDSFCVRHQQARSRGWGWGCDVPPQICRKVQFLSQSGLIMGLYEGVGPKGPLSGVPQPPKIESGYGPARLIWYKFYLSMM